ncbi:MAG: hypothetical protein JXR07_20355 [Reichenbachiella sp.]
MKKPFINKLAHKLIAANLGEVEIGTLEDSGDMWLQLKVGTQALSFSFLPGGKNIDNVRLFNDVIAKVHEIQIFPNREKRKLNQCCGIMKVELVENFGTCYRGRIDAEVCSTCGHIHKTDIIR